MNKKNNLLLIILAMFFITTYAQQQLVVDGMVDSDDTVAIIRVNSNAMFSDVVGLDVFSHPAPGRGIGGSFYGGQVGLKAEGRQTALLGKSQNAWGVFAESTNGSAAYFKSGDGKMDIVFGGSGYGSGAGDDEGVIGISASKPHGDLYLISNDALVLKLDNHDDDNGHLILRNGTDVNVLTINESGFITFADGTLQRSAPFRTKFTKGDVSTSSSFTLGVANLWQEVGGTFTFTKERDDTQIKAEGYIGLFGSAASGGLIEYAIRIDDQPADLTFSQLKGGSSPSTSLLQSIFHNLSAGTHSVEIYARSTKVPSTNVSVTSFGSFILITELF